MSNIPYMAYSWWFPLAPPFPPLFPNLRCASAQRIRSTIFPCNSSQTQMRPFYAISFLFYFAGTYSSGPGSARSFDEAFSNVLFISVPRLDWIVLEDPLSQGCALICARVKRLFGFGVRIFVIKSLASGEKNAGHSNWASTILSMSFGKLSSSNGRSKYLTCVSYIQRACSTKLHHNSIYRPYVLHILRS